MARRLTDETIHDAVKAWCDPATRQAAVDKYGEIALVKLKFGSRPGDGNGHYGPSDKKKRRKFPVGAAMIEFQNEEDLKKAAEETLTKKEGEKVEPKAKIVLAESETRKSVAELGVMLLSEYVAACKEKKEKRDDKKRSEPEPNEEKRSSRPSTLQTRMHP